MGLRDRLLLLLLLPSILVWGQFDQTKVAVQKKITLHTNVPRFLQEGDHVEFVAGITNLGDSELTGQVILELLDAANNTSVYGWFQNMFPSQYFTVAAGKSIPIKFPIQIPYSFNRPLTWRIVARSGNISDGEENVLPVLSSRMLLKERLPLLLKNDTVQHFSFTKLMQNSSESLTHQSLTVEYTSNPIWYAIQSLPYLMEYPYECAEQSFNRFYANILGVYIARQYPAVRKVFELWKQDSTALQSTLQKNSELKQLLLQETPWVLEGGSEATQKKNIAVLFDLARLNAETKLLTEKLVQLQLPNGSFPWFRGGDGDRYITNYILTGIGKLKMAGILTADIASGIQPMLEKGLQYTDGKILEDYNMLLKEKADTNILQLSPKQMDYLFMRSYFTDIAKPSIKAIEYYYRQGRKYWAVQKDYYKAALGLVFYRSGERAFVKNNILASIMENAINDPQLGRYWKNMSAGAAYSSPVEFESMMIVFMSELMTDKKGMSLGASINEVQTWLLRNKQTTNWKTTIATADACYALLLNNSAQLSSDKKLNIQLGNYKISNDNRTAAGTGYFRKTIEGNRVNPDMGNITVAVSSKNEQPDQQNENKPSWGAVYWQYFEDINKIKPATTALSVNKKMFIERHTDKGVLLVAVKEGDELKSGDKIIVRLELRSDRDMDYLHLKDRRAACMEPVNIVSGYRWQNGLGFYESTMDASSNFFIAHLKKGRYVFDYSSFITHPGIFTVGPATIECMYAPEFSSHSESIKIRVEGR